jgi:hypothetical protein
LQLNELGQVVTLSQPADFAAGVVAQSITFPLALEGVEKDTNRGLTHELNCTPNRAQ